MNELTKKLASQIRSLDITDREQADIIDQINCILNPDEYVTPCEPGRCNHSQLQKYCMTMTDEALAYSIQDAQECIDNGINAGKYYDQISIYRNEQRRRKQQ